MNSDPSDTGRSPIFRAAAISNLFMGLANNGGLNSFLTASYDFDASEVVKSLEMVGASIAATQLSGILKTLGSPLPAQTQDERWDILDRFWPDELDPIDVLSAESDDQLMSVLSQHVAANEDYYLNLD